MSTESGQEKVDWEISFKNPQTTTVTEDQVEQVIKLAALDIGT